MVYGVTCVADDEPINTTINKTNRILFHVYQPRCTPPTSGDVVGGFDKSLVTPALEPHTQPSHGHAQCSKLRKCYYFSL